MSNDNTYDYSKISENDKSYLPLGFQGNVFRLSYNWNKVIPYYDTPIKIMEIGSYHGANVCSLTKTFATHKDTEIHCVDPWINYDGYNEYTQVQPTNYSIFLQNISKLNPDDLNKIYLHRELSENAIPKFMDNSFDIIFIDGNHETLYVLQDAILSFKKIKINGWIIFDDMQSPEVQESVRIFLNIYRTYFDTCIIHNCQLFIRRIK
jgi:hypothetical protein